ncbi:MAG: hypothetical protein KGM98_06660, partial [Bacteroidota bacterium]|nr:hypothetical protein [Bacteroidota bacterium]
MRTPKGAIIFSVILLLMNIYVFQAVVFVSQGLGVNFRVALYTLYWVVSIAAIFGFMLFVFTKPGLLPQRLRTYLFATIMGIFLANVLAMVFFLLDDGRRLVQFVAAKLFSGGNTA